VLVVPEADRIFRCRHRSILLGRRTAAFLLAIPLILSDDHRALRITGYLALLRVGAYLARRHASARTPKAKECVAHTYRRAGTHPHVSGRRPSHPPSHPARFPVRSAGFFTRPRKPGGRPNRFRGRPRDHHVRPTDF